MSGIGLKVSRDPGCVVERGRYDYISWSFSSASGGSCEAVEVACFGRVVGAVGAAARGSAASFSFARPLSVSGAGVFGRDLVRAVHGHALDGDPVSRARLAERRDLSPAAGGVVAARPARRGDPGLAAAVGGRGQARLVKGDRRRVAGRREKGGEKVARSLLGRPGSRYHLAVDANGLPLEVRLAAGNENEQRHLLPLIDALLERGIRPDEVWADRGYDSNPLAHGLRERTIEPRISKRTPAARADPSWPDRSRGLARQETPTQDTRPPGPTPLADRTHQRVAESETPDRYPPRPQSRQLPRLPPPRHDHHPHQATLRSAPDTTRCPEVTRQAVLSGRRRSVRTASFGVTSL